jgi:glycogen debranching enzyme
MLAYALDQIPFSRSGSFLIISSRNSSGSPRLIYKTCSSRIHKTNHLPFPAEEFFELAMIKADREIPYTWQAYPHRLDLTGETGEKIIFIFHDFNTILFQAINVGLKLMPCKVFPIQSSPQDSQFNLVDWYARGSHMFRADGNTCINATISQSVTGMEQYQGEYPISISFEPLGNNRKIHGQIRFTRYEKKWESTLPDLDVVISARQKEIARWMNKLPSVPEKYRIPAETAWFLLWNCQVSQEGSLTRPAIYMSKFWMNGIWAWDNLFNALAVVNADPNLAWDQLMLFLDYQEPNGMVPDMITDLEPIYGFTKPPIYGWAIRKLVNKLGIKKSLPFLKAIYTPLSQLTNWWYIFRDFDSDGVPQYAHGNDSGWDNSTIFDQGLPVKGADLSAYLVLQCECLANIAELLGRKKASIWWKALSDQQLNNLLTHFIKNDHFFSPVRGSVEPDGSLSLINYLPLILGKRLPKRIRKAMIADMQPGGPFLTSFGLATETLSSPKYMPDGYWRGPVWGASTYLIVDGLIESGELSLARTIAERFCDLCMAEPGFWENYDAVTGKGLRCPGYSWTASTFLLLAEWLESFAGT